MLKSADLRPTSDNGWNGSFDEADKWASLPRQDGVRQARFFLGDPESGPIVWLFKSEPTIFPPDVAKPESTKVFPHLHRSPTYRITLGPQEKQVKFDGKWMTQGDYILLDANKVYSDPGGFDGAEICLVFADRRGVHPASKASASMSSEQILQWLNEVYGDFADALPAIHMANDDATSGAAITTHEGPRHGGRASGSIADQKDWTSLNDGSQVAICFMGDALCGPAVIMSRNAPHAVESPAGDLGTDIFRLVVDGTCSVGGKTYGPGSFFAAEAGSAVEEIAHGPEGSTQILVLSDRRFLAPQGARVQGDAAARLGEIEAIMQAPIARQQAVPV